MTDFRLTGRQQAEGKVRINWRDPGGASFGSIGRIADASSGGFCVDLDRRIAAGSTVQIESPELRVAGLAVVRHCIAKGMGYRLGLQFDGGPRR